MADKQIPIETRFLLALALSALVLFLYVPVHRKFFPPAPPSPPAQPTETPAPVAEPHPAPAVPARPAASRRKTASSAARPEPAAPVAGRKEAERETETAVENDLYRVTFSNRGATVKSWILKKYLDHKKQRQPLDLVNHPAVGVSGPPFMIWTDDEALRNQVNSALFQVQAGGSRAPARLVFEYSDGTVSARKEFGFEHGSYVVDVSSQVQNGAAPVAHELAWRGSFGDHTAKEAPYATGVVLARPEKIERHTYKDVKSESLHSGPFLFSGIEDMYFAAVFMPGADAAAASKVLSLRIFRTDFQREGAGKREPLVGVGAGGAAHNHMRVFVGPKAMEVLSGIYPEPGAAERARRGEPVLTLAQLIDFGWFAIVAKPLFLALKWIYQHIVPNYGWAIVVLTIGINMALFPLKLKSMKSALKMQKMAPQVRAIQEKYKKLKLTDPKRQQQNQEVMELYRKHGINPIGGCFPMLLQIPFLYGFYKVLSLSIEMRHAPWFGWIKDLSAADPLYILPVVMTVTMFFLQKMTPQTTTDPAQARMFTFMPLIFGVMFLNVSSGLVLYWLVGNLVGMAQQWYINKTEWGAAVGQRPAMAKEG